MKGWLARHTDILLGHLLSSLLYRPGEPATTDLNVARVYQRELFTANPERFFDVPPEPPPVSLGELCVTRTYFRQSFTFPSPYRPLSDAFAQRYASYHETHTMHGWIYRPITGRSRATLLLMHGWTGGRYWWEERSFIPWLCRDCGYRVVALVHPYHGARTPAAARFSGEFFISPDLVRTVEACRQAVIDARAALNWLLTEIDGPIGITGISLGAFMTYLLLCVDDRLAFAVPLLGHGELLNGPGGSSLAKHVRRGIQAQGLDPTAFRDPIRPLTAREMRPRLPPERILPINGRYDAIVTADKAQQLFEAWEIPEVVWLDSGHFGIIHTRPFRRAFREFVGRWTGNYPYDGKEK